MPPTKFRWQPCLLTVRDEMSNLNRGHSIDDSYQVSVVAMFVNDRDEMSNLHRGPSIDASYQVSVHLAKRFQRRRFKQIGQSEVQRGKNFMQMSHCHQSCPYTTGYSGDRISCRCPVVISPIHILQGTVRKEFHVDVLFSSVLSIYYRVQ